MRIRCQSCSPGQKCSLPFTHGLSREAFVVTLLPSLTLPPQTTWPLFAHIIYLVTLAHNLKVIFYILISPVWSQNSIDFTMKISWMYIPISLFPCPCFRPSSSSAWIVLLLTSCLESRFGPLFVILLTTIWLILVKWNSITLDLNL